MNKFKGFLFGMTASSTFGLLPLFTLPIMSEGLTTNSILCYRMLFASVLVAVLMQVRKIAFRTNLRELLWFAFLGFFYYGSASLPFALHYPGYYTRAIGGSSTFAQGGWGLFVGFAGRDPLGPALGALLCRLPRDDE